MNSTRRPRFDIIGLIVLGLLAVTVSGLALMRDRSLSTVTGVPELPKTSEAQAPTAEETEAARSDEPEADQPSSQPPAATGPQRVVIIGDSYSIGDPTTTWAGPATQRLGWANVTNLSAPGRGFIAQPRDCDPNVPCTPFGGAIEAIAAEKPNLVITFGGVADGDVSISAPSADYFTALRAALPDAKLVTLSTITTDPQVPYWVTLHGRSLREATESVGGVYIDLGQLGVGDGATLSPETQAAIAQSVADQLA